MTLVSHLPKNNKAVCLISSMHHCESIYENTGKPEIIAYYNSIKGGVDEIDKKCSIDTCNRQTQRWAMMIFYRMLDISTVDAHVLYQADGANAIHRGQFIKILARNTVLQHILLISILTIRRNSIFFIIYGFTSSVCDY